MKAPTWAWAVGLWLTGSTAAVSSGDGLHLEIAAPPELSAQAAQVAAIEPVDMTSFLGLLGLADPGDPVRVVLVAEGTDIAARVPHWIVGLARGRESLVILFPGRVPSYPYSSLPELVRHETAHVLIDRAAGGVGLPRWFHEGLAMTAEGSWRMTDRSRFAMAMLRSREPTLDELSMLFDGGEQRSAWAYAISGALVRDLVRRHGSQPVAGLLVLAGRGQSFEDAFAASFGLGPDEALATFWRRSTIWYRWLPFITSSTVLWMLVTLLALLAIRRRRERDRAIHATWDEEDRLLDEETDELVN